MNFIARNAKRLGRFLFSAGRNIVATVIATCRLNVTVNNGVRCPPSTVVDLSRQVTIDYERLLGGGGLATVYHGTYCPIPEQSFVSVAVKSPRVFKVMDEGRLRCVHEVSTHFIQPLDFKYLLVLV